METLLYILYTLNSSANSMRRVTEGNKKFLVVPTTILMPKVLHGSKGSLYYPPEEIAKSVNLWNGIPLIAPAHPTLNGQPILGISPQAWARYEVGRFYGSTLNAKGGIDGESWFDEDEVRAKEPRLLDRLNSKLNIDVSTGLRHSLELHEPRMIDGKQYEGTVRNYRPDHIAVLMDEKGACSSNDGCGIIFNAITEEGKIADNVVINSPTNPDIVPPTIQPSKGTNDMEKTQLVDWLVLNCDCWKDASDKDTLNSMSVDKLKKLKEKAQEAVRNHNVVSAVTKGFGEEILTLNSADAITDSIKKKVGTTIASNPDNKDKTVSAVAGNGQTVFNSLNTPAQTTPTPTGSTTSNSTPSTPVKSMTKEEYLAAMPAELRPIWNSMMESQNNEMQGLCNRLTDVLTNNSQDEKVRKPVFEAYAKMDLPTLRNLVSNLPQQVLNSHNGLVMPMAPVYAGQSGMVQNGYGTGEKEPESLGLAHTNPWDWGK